jgi:NAD(P)-dependent dehydrogenase (short-subunit alcohol dehydrogenase family)
MEWKNKIAIITGASTGIGAATRNLLSNKEAIVYNLDINPPTDKKDHFIECDIRSRKAIREAVKQIADKEQRIDMLFANAGIHLFAGIEDTSDEQLDNIIAINILGPYCILQAVLPYMKQQQKGAIVLMGSDQTHVGKASSSAYGMTKGAIGQLTKSTAIDYAKYNVRVNCICPGTIDTPLLHKAVTHYANINAVNESDVYAGLDTVQPLGRIGRPEEIASVVAFLLSDENSFMTGSLVSADGGYVCQ